MFASEDLVFERCEFPFIGILPELIPSEVEEFFFGSYLRDLDLDMERSEKIPK